MEKSPQVTFQLDWRAATVTWLFVMFAILLIVAGLYAFASTMTTAQVVFVFVALLLAGGAGWRLRGSRDGVAVREEPEMVETVTMRPQLPAPQWVPTAPNTLTHTDRLDVKARLIAQVLRDANAPPTRESIKAHSDAQGNEEIRLIVSRWARWGWCTPSSQGKAGEWIDNA